MPWIINAVQLDKLRKSQKNVTILDASWHLPNEGRNPHEEYLAKHISSAKFLDITAFHDQETKLHNMLTRDEKKISELVGALGITNEHKIIFYDNSKLHSSCRALWMFKVFGHNPNLLYILDGGYEAWEKFGGKIEMGEPKNISAKPYTVDFQAHFVRTLVQMKTNLHHPAEQVIDVRHPVRYAGGPELHVNTRSGHIPGSFCFPYFTMFEQDGRLKPIEKIRKQVNGMGVALELPIISMCGSGISAAIMSFVLDLLGAENHSLYDGSWSEWGSEEIYPGETSLDERPVQTSLDT